MISLQVSRQRSRTTRRKALRGQAVHGDLNKVHRRRTGRISISEFPHRFLCLRLPLVPRELCKGWVIHTGDCYLEEPEPPGLSCVFHICVSRI